jgi:hypothetical protein
LPSLIRCAVKAVGELHALDPLAREDVALGIDGRCICNPTGFSSNTTFCSGTSTTGQFDFVIRTDAGALQDDGADVICMGSF